MIDNQAPLLPAHLPAHAAFERLVRSPYSALAVVDETGQVVGVVTRWGMQRRWTEGVRGSVALFVEPLALALQCGIPLEMARQRMADAQASIVAVYCGNSFEGLLDLDAIGRALTLRGQVEWLRKARSPVAGQA